MGTYYRIRITSDAESPALETAIKAWAMETLKKTDPGSTIDINDFWGKWSGDEWSWDPTPLMLAVSGQFVNITFSMETCGEWNSHWLFNKGVELYPKDVGYKPNFGDPKKIDAAVHKALDERHKQRLANEKIKKKIAVLEKQAALLRDQLE